MTAEQRDASKHNNFAVNGNRPALRLPADMSVRDALSAMLAADGSDALVVDDERELGIASVQAVAGLLGRETSGP